MAWVLQCRVCLFIIIFASQVCNGRVHELTLTSRNNIDQNLTCKGALLRWSCTTSGTSLKWNRSAVLSFHTHDKAGKTLFEGKNIALLLNITYVSDDLWEFISELYVNYETASSILPTSVTCGTDPSDLVELKTKVAAIPRRPLVTMFAQCGSDWNTTRFYCLTWEPPSNINDFILDYYELEVNHEIEWIYRTETAKVFSTSNERVDAVTLTAVSTCGERGSTTANVTQSDFDTNHGTSQTSANQTTNCLKIIVSTVSLLVLSTLLSISITLVACRSKIKSAYDSIIARLGEITSSHTNLQSPENDDAVQ